MATKRSKRRARDDDHNPDMVLHAELWAKYMAQGMSSEDAKNRATEEVRRKD